MPRALHSPGVRLRNELARVRVLLSPPNRLGRQHIIVFPLVLQAFNGTPHISTQYPGTLVPWHTLTVVTVAKMKKWSNAVGNMN